MITIDRIYNNQHQFSIKLKRRYSKSNAVFVLPEPSQPTSLRRRSRAESFSGRRVSVAEGSECGIPVRKSHPQTTLRGHPPAAEDSSDAPSERRPEKARYITLRVVSGSETGGRSPTADGGVASGGGGGISRAPSEAASPAASPRSKLARMYGVSFRAASQGPSPTGTGNVGIDTVRRAYSGDLGSTGRSLDGGTAFRRVFGTGRPGQRDSTGDAGAGGVDDGGEDLNLAFPTDSREAALAWWRDQEGFSMTGGSSKMFPGK